MHQQRSSFRGTSGAPRRALTPWRIALGCAALSVPAVALFATPLWDGWRTNLDTPYGMAAALAIVLALGTATGWLLARRTTAAPYSEDGPAHPDALTYSTERTRAELGLKTSEERYALAMEAAGDGHTDWNLRTGEHYISPRLLQICGYAPGTTFRDRAEWVRRFPFHPEDRPKWERAVAEHLAGRESHFMMELRIVVRGEVRWTAFHFLSTRDAAGAPVRWTGSIGDITEQKRTEDALRESQQRYERVMLASNPGLWDWDVLNDEFYVSPRFLEMTGMPPDTVFTGREDFMQRGPLHPEDRAKWTQAVKDLFAGNESRLSMELRATFNGGTRWHRLEGICFRDPTGRVVRWTGSTTDISDRKRAEGALLASQERYALAVAGSDDGLWDIDFATRRVFVSPRARELVGLLPGPETEPMDEYFAALPLHPEDAPRRAAAMQAHIAGRTPAYEGEFRMRQLDGVYRWRRIHGLCVRDAHGNPLRMAGSISDFDARRRAEDALRLSEERYALAMEASEEGHFDWNVRTDEIFASAHLKKVLDLPADIEYRTWEDMVSRMRFHPGDAERVRQMTSAVLAGSALHNEFEYRLRRGAVEEPRWIRARWKIFRDAGGEAYRVIGVISDITERKLAAEALRLSEEDLRSRQEMLELAQKSARAIAYEWRFGAGRVKNRWSPDIEAMYGLAPGTYDGAFKTWKKLVHRDDWPQVKKAIRHALHTGDIEAEYRVVHPDGSVHWLQSKGRMFFDAAGRPVHLVGFMQDISLRKLADEEMRQMELELRRAQRLEAMGTLAGGIAHDFNNILGAIMGYGEMAMRDSKKGTRLRRDIDAILSAGERGRALVDRLLPFSRSAVCERVAVHVEAVVREALDQIAASLPGNVTITPRLRAGRAATLGDSTQVHQVVMNLASNAIQAMPQGGVLRVVVEATSAEVARSAAVGSIVRGDYIVLRVSDTGSGIANDVLERMFDPFFTTKDVGVGTGLGLSLVHGIVTSVEGAIEVTTEVGKGTTFTVYLRRSGDAPEELVDDSQPVPRGEGQRVLVVDDEELLVRLATETLEDLGYAPVGFTSSTAALAAFRADPARFDAVLTDERMPGLSGSALIREVRGIRDAIPVVLMSGYLGMESVDADVVVRKPLSMRDLAASLAQVLNP